MPLLKQLLALKMHLYIIGLLVDDKTMVKTKYVVFGKGDFLERFEKDLIYFKITSSLEYILVTVVDRAINRTLRISFPTNANSYKA